MKMCSDDKWLRQKAAQEDGCYVSAGADHIPPSEAELEKWSRYDVLNGDDVNRLIAEIRRLRELCKDTAGMLKELADEANNAEFMEVAESLRPYERRLRAASEGQG